MDVDGRVLRFDSMSKVLSSGLRVGWATGPVGLIDCMNLITQTSNLQPSSIAQAITFTLVESWGHQGFYEHTLKVALFYKERCQMFCQFARKHLTGLAEWSEPDAGMFIWFELKGIKDASDLILNKAVEKMVLLVPGIDFYSHPEESGPSPTVRASFSNVSEKDMDLGLERLASLVRDHATSTFLLRQLASAYSTSLEALELLSRTNQEYGFDHTDNISTRRSYFVLKQKLWILHTTIFGAMLSDRAAAPAVNNVRKRFSGSSKDSPEKLVKDLWKRLVDDYSGMEGDVDGQVMVPFTLMCVNQKLYALARQIVEDYLASIPEGMLIHLETAAGVSLTHGESGQKDPLMTNYERLVELYLIHVLAKLNEWESATDFLQYNTVLSESSKKAYGKIINKLHQKSLRPKKPSPTKQHPAALDSGSKSLSASSSSSIVSTFISSPTLSSASVPNSSANSHSLDSGDSSAKETLSNSDSTSSALNGSAVVGSTKKPVSSTLANNVRTKVAVTKQGSSSAVSPLTLQGKILVFLKHYIDLIKDASSKMGPNQLMVIVGLVAFMGVLSRNRTKASEYLKAGMAKVMQTVKMGTTVTSI
ncbi:hypothetical protein BGX27_001752 [Mortierella sp. AM989]|nr:hypothetical protein BGX27_001752 [Mortierella sp. AM989]